MFIQETMRYSGSYGSFGESRFPILFEMGSPKNCIRQFEKASGKGATWLPVHTKLEQFRKKPNQEKFMVFSQKNIFLYLGKWNFVVLRLMEFLYFLKKYFFYFFGKWNFLKNLFFPEGIYQARKIKKSHFDKTSYILRNGTF